MALLSPEKEQDIREKLEEIFTFAEAHVFTRPRQITSMQHFVTNTGIDVLGKKEIRYVEFYSVGLTDQDFQSQLDDDCVPVRINYRGQVGFQYVEKRSDDSFSYDDVIAFIIKLRNHVLDNQAIQTKGGLWHDVGRLTETAELRIEDHPITNQATHLWDFSFYVEVTN